jgi:hypothetical protein
MKVADDAQLPFPNLINNESFVFFTDGNIMLDQPYVTAEISASRYSAARNYILGDSSSSSPVNDAPIYVNGPLNESTTYTVFVWAFPARPLVGVVGVWQ